MVRAEPVLKPLPETMLSCSGVSDFATLWTESIAHQAPLSVRFLRQEN